MDLQKLMQAAQGVQNRLTEAQGKLDDIMVEGAAGGGLVKVSATARGKVTKVSIDPSMMQEGERDMLEDLLVAALNDTRAKAENAAQAEMAKVTQGLPLPPGMKLPF